MTVRERLSSVSSPHAGSCELAARRALRERTLRRREREARVLARQKRAA